MISWPPRWPKIPFLLGKTSKKCILVFVVNCQYFSYKRRLWLNRIKKTREGKKLSMHIVHKLRSVKKETKLNQGFCLIKSSEIIFIFLTEFYMILWLMTSLNNFEKILILKTWRLFFFWGIKTCFGILPLKWCFLRHEKINIWTKICHSFWPN